LLCGLGERRKGEERKREEEEEKRTQYLSFGEAVRRTAIIAVASEGKNKVRNGDRKRGKSPNVDAFLFPDRCVRFLLKMQEEEVYPRNGK
jgi:hypothetical protein